MRSPSIEWLHAKLDKHIKLAAAYTERKELEFIITSCRLKPFLYIFKERDNKIILYRWWFDEFGNSLKIIKNKRINIIYNELKIEQKDIVCTDMYYGLSMNRIAKMSKLVLVCYGKDEDLYKDCCLITFLGIDNHLRSYLLWNGEWQIVSPLLLGMRWLKILSNNLDIKRFFKIENKEKLPIPCISGKAWLSFLPASEEFLSILNKESNIFSSIFKES